MYVCMYYDNHHCHDNGITQGPGKKGKSMADIQRAIARKRKSITHGLPDWGKDLPDDVSTIENDSVY